MTETAVKEALEQLTESQRAAAEWDEGALLVLAGPGSGKTRVLTSRIARILDQSRDRTFRVLALTFTNKAADEMASRVLALTPGLDTRALVGTFHSFCMQILQQHGSHIGIKPDFAIYSLDDDRKKVMREALQRANHLDKAALRYIPVIDKLKARLIAPSGCSRHFRDPAEGQRIEAAYAAYEAELARSNALDFSSLIARAYALVTEFPGIAARYRRTYPYWLIDEFQDTTDGQYRLIKALAGEEFRNVFAVADDDQIIYQWNGASFKQLQRFRTDFQPELIQLPTNYRCPAAIVTAANRLVVHNAQRTATKLPLEAGKTKTRFPSDRHITLRHFATDAEEATGIAADTAQLGQQTWSEVAILARTRGLLDGMRAALHRTGIPSVIAQRRDDFGSPQFRWLCAALRQAARPLDRRNFEALASAFNRMFDTDFRADLLLTEAEGSSRAFLEEWALMASVSCGDPTAVSLSQAAHALSQEPTRFRGFIETALETFPTDSEATGTSTDLIEDYAAWSDLVRNIAHTIGRDAPLEQFLQELSMRSKEPPTGPETVTLMTIHGSKGKEFDHVYVIGLVEEVLPSFQSLRAGDGSAEMEEERRNCFVAITRTRECLTLSWADRYRSWARIPSRFLREMGVIQRVD